jgi:hypothetical protein
MTGDFRGKRCSTGVVRDYTPFLATFQKKRGITGKGHPNRLVLKQPENQQTL